MFQSAVAVETAPAAPNVSGLRFSFDWAAVGGSDMGSVIDYKVHAEDPAAPIDRVQAAFNGDLPGNIVGPGTFARVTETARTASGASLGTLELYTDGDPLTGPTGPGEEVYADGLDLLPPLTDLRLSKAITVNSEESGIATISLVDNTFRVVPEPSSSLLWTACAAGICLGRVRARHSNVH